MGRAYASDLWHGHAGRPTPVAAAEHYHQLISVISTFFREGPRRRLERLQARARHLLTRAGETLPGRVARKFIEDNCPTQAVSIAWNGLQSLFPLTLVLASILGLILSRVGVHSTSVYQLVVAYIPDPVGQEQVLDALAQVRMQTGLLAIVGGVGFVWTASLLFGAMEQAFDIIFHVPQRDFLRQKLMAIVMMVVFTVLAGLAVLTSTLLPLLDHLPAVPLLLRAQGPGRIVIQFVIGSVAGFVLFFVIYFVVPNHALRPRQVSPGALFAGVAFEVLTLAFPLYIGLAGRGLNQYGRTFGLLFVLMLFFYFLGVITLIGAEIIAVLYPIPIPQPDRAQALSPAAVGHGDPAVEAAARHRRRGEGRES
jgi:membrane protein